MVNRNKSVIIVCHWLMKETVIVKYRFTYN